MSIRNLDLLMRPASVAVIGASNRSQSVGNTVMRNLLAGGFAGPVMPVNPKYQAVAGVYAYPDIARLPIAPDLAVICTPPPSVPGLIAELGARGTRAAIVLTAGLDVKAKDTDGSLQQAMLAAARPHLLRILGPNCVGLIVPGAGLNASFAHTTVKPGKIAFVSQSGALATAVLDWAKSRQIGFSHFVSLGNGADVDFGDVVDYLAGDPQTQAILLYIEAINEARKFMSAARAAARNKPVIVVKAGRMPEGAQAAASHTGALAGADDVYDAAIRRAGMLRVESIEDLFDAVETLARARPLAGERLAILTNGGGPGVMAADLVAARGAALAKLDEATVESLNTVLPATWSHGNPVDIIGDAPAERYGAALERLAACDGVDAILLIHAPTAIVSSQAIAAGLTPLIAGMKKPVFASWLGGDGVAEARRLFAQAGVPTYDTPEEAAAGFLQLVDYRRNQNLLRQTPASMAEDFTPDTAAARGLIAAVLKEGRDLLTEPEAKAILAAYDIPTVKTKIARDPAACVAAAGEIGFPVAVKILSKDISHKSDVGGVALNLETAEAVKEAAREMTARVRAAQPDAVIDGFTVQQMVRRGNAHELIIGVKDDPVFGPVILFGQGGTAVEVIADRAVALPPLNQVLAAHLISQTRVAKLLAGYRDRKGVDRKALELSLLKVAQMVADLPEVVELDINPLLADDAGVVALDARLRVAETTCCGTARFAIKPYPGELTQSVVFAGTPATLRPIRPEDEALYAALLDRIAPEDKRFRFFGMARSTERAQVARYTQIDFNREMAFVAVAKNHEEALEMLGEARTVSDPDNSVAEFSILVRSDLKGKGLGALLLDKLIRYHQARGTGALAGTILPDNRRMLGLARRFGFTIAAQEKENTLRAHLALIKAEARCAG
ncbi:MAG: GNAT family N-acetyltransferase [Pseudomonadota bacterium]